MWQWRDVSSMMALQHHLLKGRHGGYIEEILEVLLPLLIDVPSPGQQFSINTKHGLRCGLLSFSEMKKGFTEPPIDRKPSSMVSPNSVHARVFCTHNHTRCRPFGLDSLVWCHKRASVTFRPQLLKVTSNISIYIFKMLYRPQQTKVLYSITLKQGSHDTKYNQKYNWNTTR